MQFIPIKPQSLGNQRAAEKHSAREFPGTPGVLPGRLCCSFRKTLEVLTLLSGAKNVLAVLTERGDETVTVNLSEISIPRFAPTSC
jgi:hypothetical protein